MTALPSSTDADTHACQPEKHNQFGADAMQKLLTSVLSNVSPPHGKCAVLIVDLSVRTCETTKAFINMSQHCGLPAYYVGVCESDAHGEYAQAETVDFVKKSLLEGSALTVPNFTIPSEDLPVSQLLSAPEKPSLTALVWSDEQVLVSDADKKRWAENDVFAAEFRALTDELKAKGINIVEKTAQTSTGASKRSPETLAQPTPIKQQKVQQTKFETSDLEIVECTAITDAIAQKVPMAGFKQVHLICCANQNKYITNDNEKVASLMWGCSVAGFHRSKWTADTPDDLAKALKFELTNSDSKVVYNGRVVRVGDVVN